MRISGKAFRSWSALRSSPTEPKRSAIARATDSLKLGMHMSMRMNTWSSSRLRFEIPSVGAGAVLQACFARCRSVVAVSLMDIVRKTGQSSLAKAAAQAPSKQSYGSLAFRKSPSTMIRTLEPHSIKRPFCSLNLPSQMLFDKSATVFLSAMNLISLSCPWQTMSPKAKVSDLASGRRSMSVRSSF